MAEQSLLTRGEARMEVRSRLDSGVVFVANDSDLGDVIETEEGAVMSHPWERRKNCPNMGECQERNTGFSVYFLAFRRITKE